MRRRRLRALAGLALVLSLTGCAEVAPWERGRLAKPHMAAEPEPGLRALREHTYMSREAALGATAGEGPGCGCY
ncbi:MAG TPA: DUF4266 domain-containing protein [Myxococcota bacterium]|nr:DUF4266 domain-containing protein [Myxococcota bacterium]